MSVEKSVEFLNNTTLDTKIFIKTSVQMCTHMHFSLWGNCRAFLGDVTRDHGWFRLPDPPVLTWVNWVPKLLTREAILGKVIFLFHMHGVSDQPVYHACTCKHCSYWFVNNIQRGNVTMPMVIAQFKVTPLHWCWYCWDFQPHDVTKHTQLRALCGQFVITHPFGRSTILANIPRAIMPSVFNVLPFCSFSLLIISFAW